MVYIGELPQKPWVWRWAGEKYQKDCLVPRLKGQHVGIIVWACLTGTKISPLVVLEWGGQGAKEYIGTLENGLVPFLNELFSMNNGDLISVVSPNDFIFMQNNAPCHTVPSVIRYLKQMHIWTMKWPANSPDLNPIKHLWGLFKRRFHKWSMKRNLKVSASKELMKHYTEELQKAWAELELGSAKKLVELMPKRIQAIIKARGRNCHEWQLWQRETSPANLKAPSPVSRGLSSIYRIFTQRVDFL